MWGRSSVADSDRPNRVFAWSHQIPVQPQFKRCHFLIMLSVHSIIPMQRNLEENLYNISVNLVTADDLIIRWKDICRHSDDECAQWRHQMEEFSTLLVLCAGNPPVPGEFPAQRPVTRSFDVFFDLSLNKRLSKQSWGWWFEKPSCPLWRHCNGYENKLQSVNAIWRHT